MTTRKTAAKAKAPKSTVSSARPASLDQASLTEALRTLMQPLAALSVTRGMPFADVEEMLKTAFVDAARAAHSNATAHRMVSRISTVTGLNRREVSRLTKAEGRTVPTRHSPAT